VCRGPLAKFLRSLDLARVAHTRASARSKIRGTGDRKAFPIKPLASSGVGSQAGYCLRTQNGLGRGPLHDRRGSVLGGGIQVICLVMITQPSGSSARACAIALHAAVVIKIASAATAATLGINFPIACSSRSRYFSADSYSPAPEQHRR
jgi:hypothetical protein